MASSNRVRKTKGRKAGPEKSSKPHPKARKGGTKAKLSSMPVDHIPVDAAPQDYPIVAVGASAGGLEAFLSLLKAIPKDVNLTFVILQHLSPNHESMLPDLLARNSHLPVEEATDWIPLKPGRIYVMPPNTLMTLEKGKLRLNARQGAGRQMPVDVFLRSLAQDQPQRAVAIILSGAGTDGSMGIEEVKSAGGITFAQDEMSAKFASMPRSAIGTGAVDFILPPEAMAEELVRICRDSKKQQDDKEWAGQALEDKETKAIFGILTRALGVDFSGYKPTTVKRRINRRMMLKRCASLGEYVDLLRHQPLEVQALYQDILIKVTSFFRDPEVFEALKRTIFPDLLQKRSSDAPLRIWVPGCSTGEEVYSIAISLLESLGDMPANTPIQIFGTDVNEEALAKARTGIYIENIALDVSPERLRRHFLRVDGQYQISKSIRDLCVFARHDLTRDHPFSRIDLISCRNLLIYLDASLQKRIFPVFHYALKPTGYLMLGTSETVGIFSDLFHLVDKKSKIFSKRLVPSRYIVPLGASPHLPERTEPTLKPHANLQAWTGLEVQREADRVVLSTYSPPGVVINDDLDILHFRGRTGPYLEAASGLASLNLLKMARPRISLALRKTIDRTKQDRTAHNSGRFEMEVDGKHVMLDIEAIPMYPPAGRESYYLILFHAEALPVAAGRGPARKSKAPSRKDNGEGGTSRQLSIELESAKEYLQTIIETHEATNEELKSANEEILSSNEELQSINEELETAKEELQSTNEELTTLNEELQNRNLELNLVNNDMTNLLSSVHVPIIMLGDDRRIRRFTPVAEKVLKLMPGDVGKPISEVTSRFSFGDLDAMIGEVIDAVTVKEMEVQDQTGHWFSLRIRPYRTMDNKIDGAVLIFIDIDRLRTSLDQLQEARNYAESMIETVRIPLAVLDREGRIRTANRAFLEGATIGLADARGHSIHELGFQGTPIPGLRDLLAGTASGPLFVKDREIELPGHDGGCTLLLNAGALKVDKEVNSYILLTLEDITGRKRAEREILRLNTELEGRIREITKAFQRLEKEIDERQRTEAELHKTVEDLEAFSYSVSHDLRAPLRAIQGIAEALHEDYGSKLDDTGKDYTRRILAAGHRMDTLIQDLLNYSRMGQADPDRRPCSLEPIVDEALVQLESEIKECKAAVRVEKPLGKVSGNPTLLSTIVLNLLSNAIKFTAPGRTPEVRLRTERVGSMLRLWVEDNGIGIDPKHGKTIFRVFERLHGVESYPGNGIGLAIVRKGAEHLGGKVGVESQPDRGSRFWVDLPPGDGESP